MSKENKVIGPSDGFFGVMLLIVTVIAIGYAVFSGNAGVMG